MGGLRSVSLLDRALLNGATRPLRRFLAFQDIKKSLSRAFPALGFHAMVKRA